MLLLRVIAGLAAGPTATALQLIGDLFVRLLKMLIVPLVFFTLASGVTKMDSPKNLRTVGGFIVTYYVLTSLVAAVIVSFHGMGTRRHVEHAVETLDLLVGISTPDQRARPPTEEKTRTRTGI